MFVRVEDLRTGHQYDVDESRVDYLTTSQQVRLLDDPRWPPVLYGRPGLPRTDKAGKPAPRRSTSNPVTPDTTAGDQS